jgi:hypothetical protein
MNDIYNLKIKNNLTVTKKLLLNDNVNIHFGKINDLLLNPKYKMSYYKSDDKKYILLKNNEIDTNFSLVFEKTNKIKTIQSGMIPKENFLWKTQIDKDGNYRLSYNEDKIIDGDLTRYWRHMATFRRQTKSIKNSNFDTLILENLHINRSAYIENNLTVKGEISSSNIKFVNSNIGLGLDVLKNNLNGNRNTIIGKQSLMNNKNGNDNVALGYNCLIENTNGINNIALGSRCFSKNKTGSSNIAIGFNSLNNNKRGDYNTNIGTNTNTVSNIFNVVGTTTLGANTLTYYNYSTAIGYGAVANKPNQIVIGRESEAVYIPGELKIKNNNNEYTNFYETIISLDVSKNELNNNVVKLDNSMNILENNINNFDISKNELNNKYNDLKNKYDELLEKYQKIDASNNNLFTLYNTINTSQTTIQTEITNIKTELNNKANSNHDHDFLRINNQSNVSLTPIIPDD